MNRHRPMTAAVFALLLATGCGSSASPTAHGRICVPSTDECPASRELQRDYPGRNTLDFSVRNEGPSATIRFLVGASGAVFPSRDANADIFETDAGEPAETQYPAPATGILREFELAPDEVHRGRLTNTELLARNSIRIAVDCRSCPSCQEPCRATVEYVRLTQQLKCESNEDCRGDRLCDGQLGACVECLDDDDCRVEQRCDSTNGRCVPPLDSGGCATADATLPPWQLGLLTLGLVGLFISRFRTRDATLNGPVLGLVVFALLSVTVPGSVSAQGPRSTLSLDAGVRVPAGDLARHVKRGVGISLQETLRGRHIGASASIGTSYFLTTQPPPPFSRELQMYEFGIGPRGFIPIGDAEITIGADYRRVGLGPNALVAYTRESPNYHALGVELGSHYDFRGIQASATVAWRPTFGLDLSVIAINLGIGVTSR